MYVCKVPDVFQNKGISLAGVSSMGVAVKMLQIHIEHISIGQHRFDIGFGNTKGTFNQRMDAVFLTKAQHSGGKLRIEQTFATG